MAHIGCVGFFSGYICGFRMECKWTHIFILPVQYFLVWQAVCWCSRFFSQRAHVGESLEPNSMVHPLQTSSERNVSHKTLASHYRLQWSWPSRHCILSKAFPSQWGVFCINLFRQNLGGFWWEPVQIHDVFKAATKRKNQKQPPKKYPKTLGGVLWLE